PDEEGSEAGRLRVRAGEGESVRDLREGGREEVRVPGRRGAVRVRVVLAGAGEVPDKELGHEVDRVRHDRDEGGDDRGLPRALPPGAAGAAEGLEAEAGEDVREEGDRGDPRHRHDVAVAQVSDL